MNEYPYYGDRGNMMNGFGSFPAQNQQRYAPQCKIVHVNGENGARSFRMAPNSDALLLDDTAPIVWLVQTDGAGYTTATPYKVTPYQPEEPVDLRALEERIRKMEEKLNAQSDHANA